MFCFNNKCTRPCSKNILNGFSLMASVPSAKLTIPPRRTAGSFFLERTPLRCLTKVGKDAMSVVNGTLNVYGIDNLHIADG